MKPIGVARKLKATDVIETLCELFVLRGSPADIRSDNGPEFVAEAPGLDRHRRSQDRLHRAG
jgi:hypothetical protein